MALSGAMAKNTMSNMGLRPDRQTLAFAAAPNISFGQSIPFVPHSAVVRRSFGPVCQAEIVDRSVSLVEKSLTSTVDSIDRFVPGGSADAQVETSPLALKDVPQYFSVEPLPLKSSPQKRAAANKSHELPISYALLGANIIIYGAGISQAMVHSVDEAQHWFGAFASSRIAVLDHLQLHHVLSASLMHGSLLHLVATGLVLFNFAPAAEKQFGRVQFAAIYALAAVAANLSTLAVTDHAAVGASGALFGIAGAVLVQQYRSGKLRHAAQAGICAASLVALDVVSVYASNTFAFHQGNAGGLIAGALLGLGLSPKLSANKFPRTVDEVEVSNLQRAIVVPAAVALAEVRTAPE